MYENMVRKTYTLTFTIVSHRDESFPCEQLFANGIHDALPDAWFDYDEGEEFAIVEIGWDSGTTRKDVPTNVSKETPKGYCPLHGETVYCTGEVIGCDPNIPHCPHCGTRF